MNAGIQCHNCGTPLAANKKFCTNCGTPVPAAIPPPLSAEQQPESAGQETSLQRSLAILGIPVSLNTLVGFFGALIVGLIVPRVLPFIFPLVYPILNTVFSGNPDPFNKLMMTGLTFLSSFVVSFAVSILPRMRKRK